MLRLLLIHILCLATVSGISQPRCTVVHYDEAAGLSQWRVTQMMQDRDGMIWFATWNGLDRFDGYEFTNFKSHAGDGSELPSDRIRDMRSIDGDSIFCQVDKRWFFFNREEGRFYPISPERQQLLDATPNGRGARGIRQQDIYHTDQLGRQWKLTPQGILYYQEGTSWIVYPLPVPPAEAKSYMSDRQGNLWLILQREVCMLSFSAYPVKRFPQEKPATIRCIFRDQRQRYWVATKEDATLRLFDRDNRLLGYLTPQGRLSDTYASFGSPIYCMAQTSDGTLWLGSKPDGLFRVTESEQSFHIRSFKGLLPNDNVYDIKEDASHRLWIATLGGGICCLLDPLSECPRVLGKSDFSHYPEEIREDLVRFLHITPDNILLAATTEGLLVGAIPHDSAQTISFRLHQREAHRQNSLSCNATMDVLEDSLHHIFVSTESGGVNEIMTSDLLDETLEFRHYNKITGLNSDITLSLCEHDGQLWITSSNQLMSLQPATQNTGYYDENFFHSSLHFSEIRPARLPDGHWLFALTDGGFTTSSEFIRKSSYVPSIALIGIDKQGTGINHSVNHLSRLVLQPNERSLTIYFAALDYVSPASINYAFKMADEDEWNYIGHNRSVSFASMKPDNYELQIRSTNSDGVWVDNIRTVVIEVQPTFWEAWYGQLLFVLLACSFIGIVIYTYIYIKGIKQQQHEMLEAYLALVNKQDSAHAVPEQVSQPESSALAPEDEAFMARVMEFIESNIADADASISDMAEATATSKSSLTRKLKSIVGLTPADFLREARIKRAAQLLTDTNGPVSDIAYHCGFTDPKYFGKCFKASIGLSPSEYRKSHI